MTTYIGCAQRASPGDLVVALDASDAEVANANRVDSIGLHELVRNGAAVGERWIESEVTPPLRRGTKFLALIEWVVCANSPSGSQVAWEAPRSQRDAVGRFLARRGWRTDVRHEHGLTRLTGASPEPGVFPEPASFATSLLSHEFEFDADWGVFSSASVDAGTRLLAECAAAEPANSVADIGTGYGALAIALGRETGSSDIYMTDIDSPSLLLAERNASRAGVAAATKMTDDPVSVPPTELTVCNLPTHVSRVQSDLLLAGLAKRALSGRVLVVVHASLHQRYATAFARAGCDTHLVASAEHTVLELSKPKRVNLHA